VVYIFYPFFHLRFSDGEKIEQVTETPAFYTLSENGAKSLAGGDLERIGLSRGPRLASLRPRCLARAPSMVARDMLSSMGRGGGQKFVTSARRTPPILSSGDFFNAAAIFGEVRDGR